MSFFTISGRKTSASQKLLVLFLAFCISVSVIPDLAASMAVIEEADFISEILDSRDINDSRNLDGSALLPDHTGDPVSGLRQYVIRTDVQLSFTWFAPHILPIRGSPRT